MMAAGQNDYGQVLHTFFCRALYDYQSNDLSSLSFKKGNIIEVLTQLESGWWDGLLNEERGWFPSNYVVQITDQEAAAELLNPGPLPSKSFSEQDSEWLADEVEYRQFKGADPAALRGSNGATVESWVPEVTSDGQIYYVNTATGETAREMPSDADFEPAVEAFPTSEVSYLPPSRMRSDSSMSEKVSSTRELAGFGVRRRSNTPEPWIKRLADDGMSYYYVHSITGETSWTPPSPRNNGKTRLRTDSDTTYNSNRLSVYSDNSDIHPFMASNPAIGNAHIDQHPPSADTKAAEDAARQLQKALQPGANESFADLVTTTRASIAGILEPTANPDLLVAKVDKVVLALRHLLYISGTLVAGIKLISSPPEDEDVIINRLKPLQRKVTATLSKVVLSARAARFNPDFATSTLGRVQQDARDLDRTVVRFVDEVEQSNLTHLATKRLTGILMSGDGAAGIGVGLVGAGIGGSWKGLGYVPMDEAGPSRRLGTSLITEFQDQRAILDEKAQVLAGMFTSSIAETLELRDASRDFLSRLFILTNSLADTNVAQHVDVDGCRHTDQSQGLSNEDAYVKSIHRARQLVRRLEATTQALYDGGAIFLLAAQSPDGMAKSIKNTIPTLTAHIATAVELIVDLYAVGHEQANLASEDKVDYDYSASLTWRMSRNSVINPFNGASLGTQSSLAIEQISDHQSETVLDSSSVGEEEVVDMEAAFSTVPRIVNGSGSTDTDNVDFVKSAPSSFPDFMSRARNGSQSDSLYSVSHPSVTAYETASLTTVTNATPVPDVNNPMENTEDLPDDEDLPPKPKPKSNSKASKIAQVLGTEAPTRTVKDESKPWYMRADYPPQDIMLNPDGSVRAGTLTALVEHLTDHDYRDANYIRTFLLTFKSFSTIDEIFDLLVKRFHTPAPNGLSEVQYTEWRNQKKDVFQIRVLNVMKQIITEEDVLDQDDTGVLARIRDFAIVVQDVSPPAKLLVRVTERALNGEDAIVKTLTKSVNSAPPPSILPRMGKKMKLLDVDPTELARQLTIMDATLYSRIRVTECLMRAKEQKSKNSDRDNISSIIERTNQLAAWINQQVLEREDSRKRAAVVKYFITVADRCRSMHNFSTMAALVSGLNTPPVRRLKRTWDQVGGRSMAMLEICEKTFDSNKNFNNYRTTLASIQPPCVPFLGVYLSTLVFINEGSKDVLPAPPLQLPVAGQPPPTGPSGPLINFAKRQKAAEVIREIKNWQTKPYNLHNVPVIQSFIDDALGQLGKVDEMSDFFWNRSLELEPREREDEKMARLLQESGFL